ncbi:hypothetical protein GJ496_011679 [Pomphorhynchus laevis]|nr:hypothetical protein GJ496_011679 [Pomphorhynchus laevis]
MVDNSEEQTDVQILVSADSLPIDEFVACYKLQGSDSFAISPGRNAIFLCCNLDRFKKLIIQDEATYNDYQVLSSERQIIYVPILKWFLNCDKSEDHHDKFEHHALLVYKSYESLMNQILDSESRKFILQVEMRSFQIINRMVRRGLRIDQKRLHDCVQTINRILKTKSSSTDKSQRDKLKYLRTLIENIQTFAVPLGGGDYYTHNRLKSKPTSTGTYQINGVSIQSIPSEFTVGTDFINPRDIFTGRDTQHQLISIDFSEFGLRVLAFLSNNEFLKSKLREPEPFVAIVKSIDDMYSEIGRYKSKQVVYSMLHEKGLKVLAKHLDINIEEAIKCKTKFLNICQVNGKEFQLATHTFIGKRNVDFLDGYSRVQCTASEIVKLSIVKVYDQVKEVTLVYYNNDELIYECDRNCWQNVVKKLRKLLTQVYFDITINVKIKVGASWGQLQNVD